MKKFLLFVALFLVLTIQAQESKTQIPQISVSGEGKVKVAPDQVIISVGFKNSGKDSKDVKSKNDDVVANALKFLKKSGLSEADFKTTNVSLMRTYDYDKKVNVYQANQTLTIMLQNIKKYDEIMMGLADVGVNTINGVEFKSSKQAEVEREVRKKAMLDAQLKATDYATAIGQKIGKAILITDNSPVSYPRPMYAGKMMTMASDDSAPKETLAAGEIEIIVNVSATFMLE